MKSLFRLLLILCSMASVAQTRTVLVTKDNWQALHSRVKLQPDLKTATTPAVNTPDQIQIGIFYAIVWPTGQAQYEFDWAEAKPEGSGCPPDCRWYGSNTLEFSHMIVNVNGTAYDATAELGSPFSESGYLGVAWFADPQDSTTLSTCQPLTQMFVGKLFTYYQTSCIDVALQLAFPTNPYTFTLVNGGTFTTRKVNTSFIVPLLGKPELIAHCDDGGVFCGGQTIPVYVQRVAVK
jgi:hypothetical protein